MLFFLTKIQTPSDLNPADLDALPHLVILGPRRLLIKALVTHPKTFRFVILLLSDSCLQKTDANVGLMT